MRPMSSTLRIWPHDDAIAMAKKTTLTVNPVNGIAEIRVVEPARETPTTRDSVPAEASLSSHGVSVADLVEGLGLDDSLARAGLAATTEDQILSTWPEPPSSGKGWH